MTYKTHVRAALGKKKFRILDQLNYIKLNVSASEYQEALKMHPNFKNYLYKNSFFKNLEDIYQKEPFEFTADFKKEFKWACNTIEQFLPEINEFIQLKYEFENNFMLEKYELCNSTLKEIQIKFGVNLWVIESDLLLSEKINGTV